MANYLITGSRNNTPHITSMDDASLNAGIIGNGAYILNRGEKLRAEMTTANNCRIHDGDIVCQGRHIRIETSAYIDLTVNNGTAGMKRNDLVVARYTNDVETGVESVDFVVIEGTPSATPSDPEYNEGNIFDGDLIVDFPLYRIRLDGITAGDPELICSISPNAAELMPQSANGYCKLPDGTLICYGRAYNGGEGFATVNFAQAFKDVDFAFTATAGYLYGMALTLNTITQKTSVNSGTVYLRNSDGSTPTSTTVFVDYIAIGRWK